MQVPASVCDSAGHNGIEEEGMEIYALSFVAVSVAVIGLCIKWARYDLEKENEREVARRLQSIIDHYSEA
jgi:hypothetical protein